jgi:hypothetical protein
MFRYLIKPFGFRAAAKPKPRNVKLILERLDERLVPSGVQEADPIIVFSVHDTGTWAQDLDSGTLRKISNFKATAMDEGMDGHLFGVYADGTWMYSWYSNSWTQLTTAKASVLDAAEDDTLVASYTDGTWEWDGTWGKITSLIATDIAAVSNNHTYLELDSGLWEWHNYDWRQRSSSQVVCMDAAADGYLYASFDVGTYRIADDGGAWHWLTNETAIAIAARSGQSAALSFDVGTFAWHHVHGWELYSATPTTQLHYEMHWGVIGVFNTGTYFIHDGAELGSGDVTFIKLTSSKAILV